MTDGKNLEDRLRLVLAEEAGRLVPGDRLADIRAEAHDAPRTGLPRWVTPTAAAAAVAAIAVVVWVGTRPPTSPPLPSGTVTQSTTTTPTEQSPRPTASTASTDAPTTGGTGVGTGVPVALPVYRVLPLKGGEWRLVREFVSSTLGDPNDEQSRVKAAVSLALADPARNASGFVNPWQEGTEIVVSFADPEIQLVLSKPGRTGFTPAQQQMAVQQLVWTATAAAGRNVPVPVTANGAIFEDVQPNVFKRPGDERIYEEIAPVWVDVPTSGQVLPVGSPVHVAGLACTFEGSVSWTLQRDGVEVSKGAAQASSGCPQQGSWTVDLGALSAGGYSLRAFEASAADGSAVGEIVVPFTVQ